MPINFPASPTLNDTYTFAGYTWIWNGSAWDAYGSNILASNNTFTGTNTFTSATSVILGTNAVGLIIKASSSQTQNLTEWQNNAGVVRTLINSFGQIAHGSPATAFSSGGVEARFSLSTVSASSPGIIIQGVASQTGNLTEWQNSASSAVAYITSIGDFVVSSTAPTISSGAGNTNRLVLVGSSGGAGGGSGAVVLRGSTSATNSGGVEFWSTTERARINSSGSVSIASTSSTLGFGSVAHQLGIVSTAATNIGQVIRGAASQTGDLLQFQDSSGNRVAHVTNTGSMHVGYNLGSTAAFIEIGSARTTNGFSYIDFISDTTYTDFALRIIRNQDGPNSLSNIVHRGTGALNLNAIDTGGTISLQAQSTTKLGIASTGVVVYGGTSSDTQPELRIEGVSGFIDFHNSAAAGNYNGSVAAGDKTLIFSNGTSDTGALFIGPWSNTPGGIKINNSGQVTLTNTTTSLTTSGDIIMSAAGHVGSVKDQFILNLMGAL